MIINNLPGNPNLPPGVSDRDIDGSEKVDEYGMTYRERCEEEKGEHKADMEREGNYE